MSLPGMLEKFRVAKQAEIQALKKLQAQDALPAPWPGKRLGLIKALGGEDLAVIAEYKRASPSKGIINSELGPEEVAQGYARGGAAALSVLTEADHFQGDLAFLERMAPAGLSLLRKDFILHPLQVTQTAATPAGALLLIVRMLDDELLFELLQQSGELGLDVVVEAFDAADVARAQAVGAGIIQINNRDLDTLQTDLQVSKRLIVRKRPEEIWISASGMAAPQDLVRMQELGFDAVLVGTSLMAAADPGEALRELRKGVAS